MTDRELLELAAKAAGICLEWQWDCPFEVFETWGGSPDEAPHTDIREWNPLASDGDALRLAVKLRLCIDNADNDMSDRVDVSVSNSDDLTGHVFVDEWHGNDPHAATRRAITRAAAAMRDTVDVPEGLV